MPVVTFMETVKWDIPHEPGNAFQLRALSGRELDEARDRFLTRLTERFSADHMKALERPPDEERQRAESDDPLVGYDRTYLLRGIVSWAGPLYDAVDCNRDNRHELDETTAKGAATAIIEMSQFSAEEKESVGPGSDGSAGARLAALSPPGSD